LFLLFCLLVIEVVQSVSDRQGQDTLDPGHYNGVRNVDSTPLKTKVPPLPSRFEVYFLKDGQRDILGRWVYDFPNRKTQIDYINLIDHSKDTILINYQVDVASLYQYHSHEPSLGSRSPYTTSSDINNRRESTIRYIDQRCVVFDLTRPYALLFSPVSFQNMEDYSVDTDDGDISYYESDLDLIRVTAVTPKYINPNPNGKTTGTNNPYVINPVDVMINEKLNPIPFSYSAFTNHTLVKIVVNHNIYNFFRLTDMDKWDNFQILNTPILTGMKKPECICSYGGSLDVGKASEIQQMVPFALIRPENFDAVVSSPTGTGRGTGGATGGTGPARSGTPVRGSTGR